jgi:anti-sigma-K factor RskA
VAGRLTHEQIQDLLAAYALDAVDADEAVAVDDHLRDCPRCEAEVASYREVVASRAHAGRPAPEGLWPRIAGALEEAPPALELGRMRPPAPSAARVSNRWVAAVVAAAAAVTGVLGLLVVRQEQRVDRLAEVTRQRALEQAASSASVDPKAQRVALRSDDGAMWAKAVVQDDGTGYLTEHNLPALSSGRTYQLWGKSGAKTVSLGVLGPSPRVAAFHVDGDADTLAVTTEESGGVVLSTQAPVLRGYLPDR